MTAIRPQFIQNGNMDSVQQPRQPFNSMSQTPPNAMHQNTNPMHRAPSNFSPQQAMPRQMRPPQENTPPRNQLPRQNHPPNMVRPPQSPQQFPLHHQQAVIDGLRFSQMDNSKNMMMQGPVTPQQQQQQLRQPIPGSPQTRGQQPIFPHQYRPRAPLQSPQNPPYSHPRNTPPQTMQYRPQGPPALPQRFQQDIQPQMPPSNAGYPVGRFPPLQSQSPRFPNVQQQQQHPQQQQQQPQQLQQQRQFPIRSQVPHQQQQRQLRPTTAPMNDVVPMGMSNLPQPLLPERGSSGDDGPLSPSPIYPRSSEPFNQHQQQNNQRLNQQPTNQSPQMFLSGAHQQGLPVSQQNWQQPSPFQTNQSSNLPMSVGQIPPNHPDYINVSTNQKPHSNQALPQGLPYGQNQQMVPRNMLPNQQPLHQPQSPMQQQQQQLPRGPFTPQPQPQQIPQQFSKPSNQPQSLPPQIYQQSSTPSSGIGGRPPNAPASMNMLDSDSITPRYVEQFPAFQQPIKSMHELSPASQNQPIIPKQPINVFANQQIGQTQLPFTTQQQRPSAPPMQPSHNFTPGPQYDNQFAAPTPQLYSGSLVAATNVPASLLTGKPLMSSSQQDSVVSNILSKPMSATQTQPGFHQQSEQMGQLNLQQFQLQQAMMFQQQQQMFNTMLQNQKNQTKSEEEAKIHNLELQLESIKELLKEKTEEKAVPKQDTDTNKASMEQLQMQILKLLVAKQDADKENTADTKLLTAKHLVNNSTSPRPPDAKKVGSENLLADVILPRNIEEGIVPPSTSDEISTGISSDVEQKPFYEPEVDRKQVKKQRKDRKDSDDLVVPRSSVENNGVDQDRTEPVKLNYDDRNNSIESGLVEPRKPEETVPTDDTPSLPTVTPPTPSDDVPPCPKKPTTPTSPDELIKPRDEIDKEKTASVDAMLNEKISGGESSISAETAKDGVGVGSGGRVMKRSLTKNLSEDRFSPISSPLMARKFGQQRSSPRNSPDVSGRSSLRNSPILIANGQAVQLDDMDTKERKISEVIDHRHLARQLGRMSFYVGEPDELLWRKYIGELSLQVDKFSNHCKDLCKPHPDLNIDGFKMIWDVSLFIVVFICLCDIYQVK